MTTGQSLKVVNLHTTALGAHLKYSPGSMSTWNSTGGLQKLKNDQLDSFILAGDNSEIG